MLNRPNNMSRRGFLRNVLGISTALILPVSRKIMGPMPYEPFARSLEAAGIRGLSRGITIYDEVQDLDPNFKLPLKFTQFPFLNASPVKTVVIREARSLKVSYWPPTLPARQDPYRVQLPPFSFSKKKD